MKWLRMKLIHVLSISLNVMEHLFSKTSELREAAQSNTNITHQSSQSWEPNPLWKLSSAGSSVPREIPLSTLLDQTIKPSLKRQHGTCSTACVIACSCEGQDNHSKNLVLDIRWRWAIPKQEVEVYIYLDILAPNDCFVIVWRRIYNHRRSGEGLDGAIDHRWKR